MTKYYKAEFADGRIETRSTASRTYAGCVLIYYTFKHTWGEHKGKIGQGVEATWCGTMQRMHAEQQRGPGAYHLTRTTKAALAVEITAAEYRALRAKVPA